MIAQFDIFVIEPDGSLRWCEAAETLDSAKRRVREIAKSSRAGQFVIFNQQTGQRTLLDGRVMEPRAERVKVPAESKQPRYHICRVEKEKLRWVEAAPTLQMAETRIKVLKASEPGDYLVLDYNPEHSDSPTPWTPLTFVLSAFNL